MPIVCLQCDDAPTATVVGEPCPRCGAALVDVKLDDDLIGTVIDGRFEVTGLLGRGGMGSVYRAIQRSIGRAVAVKLMDQRVHDAAAAKRFFREAKLASQLAHPNTVMVIDFGQNTDGRLYLVMELVAGRTLHDALAADGAFAPTRLVRVGTQLCDALEAAHALGIIHRDLKPENVVLGDRDQVKVLDFGLARAIDDPTMRATATGVYAGTPRYMSPEIATGAEPSPSQDIYALGVILAELATNRTLFSAPTIEALFTKKLFPGDELDGIEPALRAVIELMVSPSPAQRPTAAEVRAQLGGLSLWPQVEPQVEPQARLGSIGLDVTETGPVQAPPSAAFRAPEVGATFELEPEWQRDKANPTGHVNAGQPRRSSTGRSLALAFGVLAVVGGAGVWWWRSHRAPAPVAAEVMPATPNTVKIHITATPAVDVTVDGKRAGKTPFTIDHVRTTRPLVIGTSDRRAAIVEVIPDRDRDVDVSPR